MNDKEKLDAWQYRIAECDQLTAEGKWVGWMLGFAAHAYAKFGAFACVLDMIRLAEAGDVKATFYLRKTVFLRVPEALRGVEEIIDAGIMDEAPMFTEGTVQEIPDIPREMMTEAWQNAKNSKGVTNG